MKKNLLLCCLIMVSNIQAFDLPCVPVDVKVSQQKEKTADKIVFMYKIPLEKGNDPTDDILKFSASLPKHVIGAFHAYLVSLNPKKPKSVVKKTISEINRLGYLPNGTIDVDSSSSYSTTKATYKVEKVSKTITCRTSLKIVEEPVTQPDGNKQPDNNKTKAVDKKKKNKTQKYIAFTTHIVRHDDLSSDEFLGFEKHLDQSLNACHARKEEAEKNRKLMDEETSL